MKRIQTVLLLVMFTAVGSFGIAQMRHLGYAQAQVAAPTTPLDAGATVSAPVGSGSAAQLPTLPDPTQHPAEAISTAGQDLKSYGYVWGGMLVLYMAGFAVIKLNDEKHWLAQDHRLSIGVSVLGLLGAVLQWKLMHAPFTVVGAALMASITLILQKPTPSKSSAA